MARQSTHIFKNTAAIDSHILAELLDVGIALANERNLTKLLRLILSEVRRFTHADAGTLYLVEGNEVVAYLAQNNTLVERLGKKNAYDLFESFRLPIDMNSIAGAAAASRETVNIRDVQESSSESRFQYNDFFDKKFAYSTHSNLAIPMLDTDDSIIGVLQLINAMRGSTVVPFDEFSEKVALALACQAAVSVRNTTLALNLEEAHLDTLTRLGLAAEWRDKETANHITRVSQYCIVLAEGMGWDKKDVAMLAQASPMHDVGKLGVPDAVLHKPGRLTPDERKIMESHTIIGANILNNGNNEMMKFSREIALWHHEKWDGTGYPQQLSGEEIPLACRLVSVADVYDALSSRRCYKEAFPHEKVLAIMREDTGSHFAPKIMTVFFANLAKITAIRDQYGDTAADFEKFEDLASVKLDP